MGMNYDEWEIEYTDAQGARNEWRCHAVSERDALSQFLHCNQKAVTDGARAMTARKAGGRD